MALKTNVVDRVSAYPGRVKLTPVSGQTNTYDMVRADQPTQAGTPLNAALFRQKADALTGDVTVYVTKSGNDSTADGTSAKPFLTIQGALNSIPKNLNGYMANINIGAGTYAGEVNVEYFADGRVTFTGASKAAVKIQGILRIRKSGLNIENIALTIENSYLYVTEQGWVNLDTTASLVCSGAAYGVYARYGGHACLTGVATIKNTTSNAIRAGENSTIYVYDATGTGNATGIYAQGGMVFIRAQDLGATTEYATAHGGKIYSGAQTSIPKY